MLLITVPIQLSKCLRGGIFSCIQYIYVYMVVACSLVPRFGQCALWYSVHYVIVLFRIPLFLLWSDLDQKYLYSACPEVWSVCLGLVSSVLLTFFRIFAGMIVCLMIVWLYFLMSSVAFFLMVLHIPAFYIRF